MFLQTEDIMKIILTAKEAKKQYQIRESLYKLIHEGDPASMVKNFIKFYGENCLEDDLTNTINSSIKQATYGNEIYKDKITFDLMMLNGHLSVLNDIFNDQSNAYANAFVNSDGTTQVGMHVNCQENSAKYVKILDKRPQQTLSNKLKASIKNVSGSNHSIDLYIIYTTDVMLKQALISAGYTPVKSNDPDMPFEFTATL